MMVQYIALNKLDYPDQLKAFNELNWKAELGIEDMMRDSYNYVLNENHIGRLIDAWICLILVLCGIALIETTVLTSQAQDSTAILKITLIKPGFFASMTNQGTILSLFQYSLSKKKKYVRIALILTSAVVLTVQLKAIVGVMMIWMLYALIMSDKNRRGRAVAAIAVTAIAAIFMMISIPSLSSKIEKYIGLYAGEESYDKVARPALYYQSVNIANDFFPLGSGQGTFGSIPVNMIYNQIYYDYGLDGIYGLGETGDDFKMDTHWSSILGENGYLGTILYLMLFCYPLTFLRKARRLQSYKSIRFIIMTVIIVVMFESLTLCIPGRMAFMFIYAGLLSIICRRITIAGKYYEGSPS